MFYPRKLWSILKIIMHGEKAYGVNIPCKCPNHGGVHREIHNSEESIVKAMKQLSRMIPCS